MKCFIKILAFLGGIVLLAKLVQMLIDCLYDTCDKKYISTENLED